MRDFKVPESIIKAWIEREILHKITLSSLLSSLTGNLFY